MKISVCFSHVFRYNEMTTARCIARRAYLHDTPAICRLVVYMVGKREDGSPPFSCVVSDVSRGCEGSFALRGDLLLSTVTKVGKNTGRNLRFLHFRARYVLRIFRTACHTFAEIFLFRAVKRIAFSPAPLPLMPTTNNAFGSIVECMSGSGARRKSIRHTQR